MDTIIATFRDLGYTVTVNTGSIFIALDGCDVLAREDVTPVLTRDDYAHIARVIQLPHRDVNSFARVKLEFK